MPDRELRREMGNVQRGAGQGRRDARRRGPAPELEGRAGALRRAASATVIDGPFAETKELVAGFWIWQVKSMDEAVEWVKRAPYPTASARGRDPPGLRGRGLRRASSRPSCASRRSGCATQTGSRRVARPRCVRRRRRRDAPRDRGRLADRVGPADRRARAHRARRRPRRGPRPGRARRRARAVAASRASRTTRAPGSWPPPSTAAIDLLRRDEMLERKHERARPRARAAAEPTRRPRRRRSTTTSATTCCA